MYDERLSQSVLSKLMWAPFIGIAFAYWMASSNQLYANNKLNSIIYASDVFEAQHLMQSVFWKSGWAAPAWPLLLTAILIQVIIWAGDSVIELVSKFVPCCIIGDMTLDEDIPIYWEGLDENDRNWAIEEEKNSRSALGGLKIMTDDAFEKLKESKENEDGLTLQGVHSYDVLANPNYLESFQYVSASQENRSDYIIDDDDDEENDAAQSDLVRAALNLAYIHDPSSFKFNSESLSRLRLAAEAFNNGKRIN